MQDAHPSSARPAAAYSPAHELANSLVHGIAAGLSLAGLVVLVVFGSINGNAWHVTSFSIYGASLFLLYLASTLYHAIRHPGAKEFFHRLDHCSIFLLIAGTYTPFMLAAVGGAWGWTVFSIIWALALIGVGLKVFTTGRFRLVSTLIYIGMGWMSLVAVHPLLEAVSAAGIAWLVAGGLCYTLGVVFYLIRRIPFHHAIWHLFVLAGSICHYIAILRYVMPWPQG